MHGTCIECPPQQVDGEKELITFSFCSDLWQHPDINESAHTVSQTIQQLLYSVDQYLNDWKYYQPLWERNKSVITEKFAAKNPSLVMYDNKLQFFYNIYQEAAREPLFKHMKVVHLNLEPLVQTVQEIARSWISSLGCLLNIPAKRDLFSFRESFTVLSLHSVSYFSHELSSIQLRLSFSNFFFFFLILQQLSTTLKLNPTTFEELKIVLTAISDIRNMAVDVEMKLYDIQERYGTLAMYKFEVLGV